MTFARTEIARVAFKPRTQPMARGAGLTRTPFVRRVPTADAPPRPRLKARQRSVTKADKLLWARVAAVGCIACYLDGHQQLVVSIHHIDGRTKAGCHRLVLPLCAGHHQAATGEDKTLIAVHPDKARFELRYGPQMALLSLVHQLLAGQQIEA